MIDQTDAAALANLFLALSDRTRLKLLSIMTGGEVSVAGLCSGVTESQPKVSRHLANLRSVGLVAARRDGKRIYYSIAKPENPLAARIMDVLVTQRPERDAAIIESNVQSAEAVNEYDQTNMNQSRDELEIFLL